MKISKIRVLIQFVFLLTFLCEIRSQCCLKLAPQLNKCLSCPADMRIYKGHCLFEISNCKAYSKGVQCGTCQNGFSLNQDGFCQKNVVGPGNTGGSDSDYTDKILDLFTNENLLILDDYSRSAYQVLQTSSAYQAFIRKFRNGTQYTIIRFEDQNAKYYEVAAAFHKDLPFVFEIKYFQGFLIKPKISTGIQGQIITQQEQKVPNNEQQIKKQEDNQNQGNQVKTVQYGEAGLNYIFLTKKDRQKDDGFLEVDKLIRAVNQYELGTNPIVLGVYMRKQGFSFEYILFYESTDKKSVYESKSIFNLLRKQVHILSLTRSYIRS